MRALFTADTNMKHIALLLGLLLATLGVCAAQSDEAFIEKTLYPATALLYSQDSQGGMNMHCTVTAIKKLDTGYRFVTAAHCVAQDNEARKEVEIRRTSFFITSDTIGSKEFLPARVVVAGYQHRGDDFALLDVETDAIFPTIEIGTDVVSHSGESVVNMASPQGLGKQIFMGHVSSPKLDRPVESGDISWTGAMLVQLFGTNGGSSGSAIVSTKQKAICGFLVGSIGGTSIVAIPVSKYKTFLKLYEEGKYKWFKGED